VFLPCKNERYSAKVGTFETQKYRILIVGKQEFEEKIQNAERRVLFPISAGMVLFN
jgi:hypothetical protein